jgi:hypothetical protein
MKRRSRTERKMLRDISTDGLCYLGGDFASIEAGGGLKYIDDLKSVSCRSGKNNHK